MTAHSVDAFVAIASALGRDAPKRSEVPSRIAANKHRLYRDLSCIAALEAFFERAVRAR